MHNHDAGEVEAGSELVIIERPERSIFVAHEAWMLEISPPRLWHMVRNAAEEFI